MSAIESQRELVITLKRETFSNIAILSKLYPLSVDLTGQVFKENALEKLTQNVFNHLSHYLVSIIDPQASSELPWPLYDTKTERAYRNQVSAFFSDYSSKGLLSPVMSSYLVNPGCYKVTFLMFQLSQLAVERVLLMKMKNKEQKSRYNDMTEQYKSLTAIGFIDSVEAETKKMLSKFSHHLRKREAIEKIAMMMRKRITEMEETLSTLKAQEYIDNLVNTFLKQNALDEETESVILEIKNVDQPSQFFDLWLISLDKQIDDLESEWDKKMLPFLGTCKQVAENTEALIARQTGEADKSSFTVEYNPETDKICTKDLENQVNSEQRYVLKNITINGQLNFPNLIRGFLVAISCILKNTEIGDEIYMFNEYLDGGRRKYKEILSNMRVLLERVRIAEGRLQTTPTLLNQSVSTRELSEVPPLPDLSDLKMNREYHSQFDTFTPLNETKYQFNLNRKTTSFTKPLPKSMLITPFHHKPNGNILNSVIACRVSSYDKPNITQNLHNMSVISQATSRMNETIADCHSGFTKQQICRILSTKKKSSTKKIQFKTQRHSILVKKGNLFGESSFSNESFALARSHSSPNLYEDREKRTQSTARSRKLSIMKEDSPSLLEVSGIAALERDSNHSTPQNMVNLESCRKLIDSLSLPVITPTDCSVSSTVSTDKANHILNDSEVDLNNKIKSVAVVMKPVVSWKEDIEEKKCPELIEKVETPKTNTTLIRKTSSLEKIINRFKKVRASVLPNDIRDEEVKDLKNVAEEKDNLNILNEDGFSVNQILLPDLLSPSCSAFAQNSNDYMDQLDEDCDEEKPGTSRPSLGAALGVDHTFLDQFDLID